jgi:hypothetical protein
MINNLPRKLFLGKPRLFLRVDFLRTWFFVFAFGIAAVSSVAQEGRSTRRKGSQIIDDTTRQIYGPTTSRYLYEEDVFFNKDITYPIDTLIWNYHRYNFVQRYNNLYQDLGNIGTAIRPIFYQAPRNIGATSGFNAFDLYWDSERVRYYDTKSPFTDMKVVLGGRGRSMTHVNFSRNINPRWNFGFNYRAMLIDKQVQRTGKGDRNVRSTYYDVYTAYQSKDSTYRLFVNFRRHKYEADENGGVEPSEENNLATYFYDNAKPRLVNAESRERRINIHLYQQYKLLGKGFQLYHVFDAYRQHNNFYDITSQEPNYEFDFNSEDVESDTVKDGTRFRSMRNEAGIKGNLAKLFYNGYYAVRQFGMDYKYYTEDEVNRPTVGTEHYLGGRMALQLDSIGEVDAGIEVEREGNFRIEGSLKSKWFEASLKQLRYSPGFLQQAYRGGHDDWLENFKPVNVTQLNGYLHYKSRVFSVSPGLTFTRLNNYVYFKQDSFGQPQTVMPVYSDGAQVIASPEIKFSLTMLRHITLSGQAIYSSLLQNDNQAIVVPELFVNSQLCYSNIFFKGNMDMQGGVDVHWKSTYYAMGYDPVIQQFYRQDEFKTPAFPVIDVFFNMKVKSGRIFVKYNNLVQLFTKSGYFPTPHYPGQRNVIDFGFDLFFYD